VDDANANSTVAIDAMIKHISGVSAATVFWREEGATDFNQTAMSLVSGDDWTLGLLIPSSSVNIEYYIEAESISGKTLARPIVAPEGFWTILVENLSNEDWASTNISTPYPNPTRGNVSFNLNQIQGEINVSIFNVLGQKLNTTTLENGNGILTLELNNQWKGTLFVTFEGEFGKVTKKVIKL
jgi:hypothetical protein